MLSPPRYSHQFSSFLMPFPGRSHILLWHHLFPVLRWSQIYLLYSFLLIFIFIVPAAYLTAPWRGFPGTLNSVCQESNWHLFTQCLIPLQTCSSPRLMAAASTQPFELGNLEWSLVFSSVNLPFPICLWVVAIALWHFSIHLFIQQMCLLCARYRGCSKEQGR